MIYFSSEIHQEVCVWVLWAGGPEVEYLLGLVCSRVDGSLWLLFIPVCIEVLCF